MSKSILFTALSLSLFVSGCSINKMAMNSIADGLAGGSGSTFSSDEDIDLVCQALPLSLKAMEALAEKVTDNKGLYTSLASGFMLYTVASVEMEAERIKASDYDEYRRLRVRAQKLYYRAYQYGLKGVSLTDSTDVPLLYWTGAALAKWITFSKDDPGTVILLPQAVSLMQKALKLDPNYDNGSLYEFMTAYESRSGNPSDTAKAMDYYRLAVKAAEGKKLSVFLTYAECFAIPFQDKKAFDSSMQSIMNFDLNTSPSFKLANALTRRRAELLLKQESDLFLEE